jgi:hypothetical protein
MRHAIESYIPGLSNDVLKLPMRVGVGGHAHGRAWRARHAPPCAPPMQTSNVSDFEARLGFHTYLEDYAAGSRRDRRWPRPSGPAVKVGLVNCVFVTKVQPDRPPLRLRRLYVLRGHSEDIPYRGDRIPRLEAAARSSNPTFAPHTFKIGFLREDPNVSEKNPAPAPTYIRLAAHQRAC